MQIPGHFYTQINNKGTFVNSKRRLVNDRKYSESVDEYSGGVIESYKVISTSGGSPCVVTIEAKIAPDSKSIEVNSESSLDLGSVERHINQQNATREMLRKLIHRPELIKVESELAQTRQTVLGREDTFKKSVIRAPMKGVVKNIHVVTIGGVIQAGQSILEIIPDDTSMLVEAFVKPSEIAFLHVGQPVVIKLTAYEFNRFGGLHGTLEHISPDTMQDENKQRKPLANSVDLDEGYYRLLISIANEESKRQGLILKPKPGMTATIEIKTGQKTVLEYLFRPLQSVTQALTER